MDFILKSFKREVRVGRLANIHYFEFTPELHTSSASHPFCELVYVERGNIRISAEGYCGALTEGEMILHESGERHALATEGGEASNIIIIGFECEAAFTQALAKRPVPLTDELQRMLAEIIKEARSVYLPPYDIPNTPEMKKRSEFATGADQLIKNYLEILLLKAARIVESLSAEKGEGETDMLASSRIGEVKKYIDDNLSERISVLELCFLFNTNKTTLSKEFRSAYGMTLIDYANSARIKETKRLLDDGGITLTEIAARFNMSSVHYLTALFKKYTGITPTEYIKVLSRDDGYGEG